MLISLDVKAKVYMDERVKKLKTPADCEFFIRNATNEGRSDLAIQARQHSIELRALAYGTITTTERECLEAIYAYEEILSAKNGKRTRASRTWQMIKRHGIISAIERAVDRPNEASGFSALEEIGLGAYTFEAVILRHPTFFSPNAVERAHLRMSQGIK